MRICPNCNVRLWEKEVRYPCRDTDTAECPECNTTICSWKNDTRGIILEKFYKTHNLKTWMQFYQDVLDGKKTFEVRKNDRDYKIGDVLNLIEVDPNNDLTITGREQRVVIVYLLTGEQWGLQQDYAVLGIKHLTT